ncbi:MAG: alanyl-tRNA editing protein [Oscillospiraceae bacterium]|nr:alanyl-tRNA editing protein [Oscillospiraceae bacterium]
MTTERLYESNAYLKEFDAQVISCEAAKGGYAVVLDRTAFYPEGGGQPCDLGVLGGARVLDVHQKDGVIVHTADAPLSGTVHGAIDWARRFDLMQQHSGEHLISGTAHRLYGVENVGFHMGAELITIDFDKVVNMEELAVVEAEVNAAIWANLETKISYYDSEAACPIDYRSKKAIEGRLRLVEFPGVDICACCGTHVARTGEIGLVKLLSVVKFHQGVRVELVCGKRAYDYVAAVTAQNRAVSGLLSAKPFETAAAVERTLAELNEVKQEKARWEGRCFSSLSETLRGAGDVLLFEEALNPDSVRRLCVELMPVCGGRCAVFSGTDEGGYAYAIGLENGDLRVFVKDMNAALNGRGGGKPNFAQGRVTATRTEIEAYFSQS